MESYFLNLLLTRRWQDKTEVDLYIRKFELYVD